MIKLASQISVCEGGLGIDVKNFVEVTGQPLRKI